jgi:hypothetical protein
VLRLSQAARKFWGLQGAPRGAVGWYRPTQAERSSGEVSSRYIRVEVAMTFLWQYGWKQLNLRGLPRWPASRFDWV